MDLRTGVSCPKIEIAFPWPLTSMPPSVLIENSRFRVTRSM
jgi:hypothetical protein